MSEMPPEVAAAIKKAKATRSNDHDLTQGILEGLFDVLGPQLAAIRKRLDQLEANPPLRYLGTWVENERKDDREKVFSWGKGACVTHAGSIWVAMRPTSAEPGTPDSGWQMAIRKPRDGRDAKDRK